jgi:hypothetical protein
MNVQTGINTAGCRRREVGGGEERGRGKKKRRVEAGRADCGAVRRLGGGGFQQRLGVGVRGELERARMFAAQPSVIVFQDLTLPATLAGRGTDE